MFLANDYMQNLNYYNQNPYMGDSFYNNRTNDLFYRSANNIGGFNNINGNNNRTNLNMLYPEIYRVIYPVVKNILDNTNISIVDDKFINSIVKNVLSILEGENKVCTDDKESNNSNANSSVSEKEDNFLEELIKVIVIKEIISIINRLNLNSFLQNNML